MFYVSTLIFIIVLGFLAAAIVKSHRRARQSGQAWNVLVKPSADNEQKLRRVVIAATAVTILILFGFLIDSFFVGRGLTAELARKNGVVIEVTGHQWWWEARYMNVDASSIFTTANEIHIPVGVPITLSLRSSDVIHSFWAPNLTGKKDLIPGKSSTIWLQADRPGIYRAQCAEYCGLQHAHMALWIFAEPLEQFTAWQRMQIQPALAPATDAQQRGQQVFLSTTCVMCHAINGTPAGSNFGPNLTHVGSRNTIAAATMQNTRDHLAQWIANSQRIKPGNRMPQNTLTNEDLQALLDYVQSLK